MSKKNTILVVAYPGRGAGNDPKLFFFFFLFWGGSLSPPRLNIFTVGNMGIMICLGVTNYQYWYTMGGECKVVVKQWYIMY